MVSMAVPIHTDTHAPCILKLYIPPSNGIVRRWLFPEFGAELPLDNCTPTNILNNPVHKPNNREKVRITWHRDASAWPQSMSTSSQYYITWMFVSIRGYPACKARVPYYSVTCDLFRTARFSNIILQTTRFSGGRGELLNTIRVPTFSADFSQILFIQRASVV